MSTFLFFDTETTGNEENDRFCQLAYKKDDEIFCELFKPPLPISFESMAVHHITEKMVADKPLFQDSPHFISTKKLFEDHDTISIAHNAPFDVAMLGKENITPARTICTLRVARALDTSATLPNYRLQYLRYALGIEVDAQAHDALGDVLVLEILFDRLLTKLKKTESLSTEDAIARMEKISSEPSLLHVMPFGKYKGTSFTEIASKDKGYLEWLLAQKTEQNLPDDEDMIHTLRHHLGRML